jgi:hypothetical protein
MGEVFREVSIDWDGETYSITPSMALLRKIKQQGIHNLMLANACINGGADPLDLVVVHRMFMREAGVRVAEDESYEFIMSGSQEMIDFQMAYVSAVLPSIDLGKKPDAPALKPKKSRAKLTRT